MARDRRLPLLFLFFSLFSIPNSNPILPSSHRRGSLAADCCASPQRHDSVPACVSECDSLIHPVKHSSLVLFSVLSSFAAALGGGWRANRVCVGSSPISLITTQREETPALRFRSQALSLVPCVSWPLASPPLPPSLSPLPSSLSISPPPPAAAEESQSEQMRE